MRQLVHPAARGGWCRLYGESRAPAHEGSPAGSTGLTERGSHGAGLRPSAQVRQRTLPLTLVHETVRVAVVGGVWPSVTVTV